MKWKKEKEKENDRSRAVLSVTLYCIYLLPEKVEKPKTRAITATTAGLKDMCQNLKD